MTALSALWGLPLLYGDAARVGFAAGLIGVVPLRGAIALAVALLLLFRWRSRRLWWFIAPFATSELLVVAASAVPGSMRSNAIGVVLLAFVAVQVASCAWLFWHNRRVWQPAAFFALFNLSYAAFAVFIASMTLSGDWL